MAINGTRFLKLGNAREFTISRHALARLREYAGREFETDEAFSRFCESRQLRFEEMMERGYRPGFKQRQQQGIPSWYFLLPELGNELIAVISKTENSGEYAWVTTYTPNPQSKANVAWVDHSFAKMIS
ncbi:MAG: hypothetical protein C4527_21155 [Candidatus Omnitrophota bacterium]|nr:MAG: hypothetical protein C4527_21155 [Candidatus Omnitrophota bacterium]